MTNPISTIKSSWKKITAIILAVIFAGGIIGGGYYAATIDLNQKEDSDSPGFYLEPRNEPVAITPATVSQTTPRAVLGTETQEPAAPVPPPAPVVNLYSNQALQFSVNLPSDWKISPLGKQVVITSPENQRYNIQMYPTSGDMAALKTFLESQPNIRQVATGAIAGNQAYAFSIDGSYRSGYAFLNNGRLYYLLGSGVQDSPIGKTFRTL